MVCQAAATITRLRLLLAHHTCVDVEQVVTGHAWLAGYACRDNDQVAAVQGLGQLLRTQVASHLHDMKVYK